MEVDIVTEVEAQENKILNKCNSIGFGVSEYRSV